MTTLNAILNKTIAEITVGEVLLAMFGIPFILALAAIVVVLITAAIGRLLKKRR